VRNDKASFIGLLTYCEDVRTILYNATPDSCIFGNYHALFPVLCSQYRQTVFDNRCRKYQNNHRKNKYQNESKIL